jgi:hypothetical protein
MQTLFTPCKSGQAAWLVLSYAFFPAIVALHFVSHAVREIFLLCCRWNIWSETCCHNSPEKTVGIGLTESFQSRS